MTPYELSQLSQPLADIYAQLESDLIQNIADYLAEQNIDCATAKWKMKALANLGKLDKANLQLIANYAGIAPDMLELALEQAALTAVGELEPGFAELVKKGIIEGTSVPIEKTVAKSLVSYSKQATEQLNLVNTVMKYKSHSIASKLIKDTAELADKQSFLNMLNKATGKAVTGIESRQAALRQCIYEMCDKGIPCFTDKLGREWSPEAYINMDIRTTCGNVAHQAQFDRMDEYDIDLIEISSHAGARPGCEPYQGRIYDRRNKSREYPHWSSTSYGQPAGILGINCGHFAYPYIPGVSTQRYFPTEGKSENDRLYKLSQQQRALERNVRGYKRECSALDKIGDTEGFKKASVKLKQNQDKLKNFCDSNKLTYKTDRLYTNGFNRNVSGKAFNSAKAVDKIKQDDIIIGKSVGAKAKNYPVKMLNSNQHTKLAEGQSITGRTFAGKGTQVEIRDRFRLESEYKIPAEEWQKVSGNGKIIKSGKEVNAELHWYEANGQIYELKIKRYLE